jgi:DNA-binding MarR family transcriptional regulator
MNSKPFAMTAREAEIVQYADEHLELSQEEIAKHFGIGRTSVSRVLVIYRPDRPKLAPGGIEAKITREIREYKRVHTDMGARAIAEALGYSKYRVEQAIRGMEAAGPGRKKKKAVEYTLKPCLKCGKPHKSTWAGDRIHPQCKESMVYQYIPNHSVYVEGNGRV